MKIRKKNRLDVNVEVIAQNRPIKVAYIVPFSNESRSQMVLDAVFFESYARWGGAYTLLLPFSNSKMVNKEFLEWLQFFDPDFIYSYEKLQETQIAEINFYCTPIAFLEHIEREYQTDCYKWRDFLPNWQFHFEAVSTETTVSSPLLDERYNSNRNERGELKIITEYDRYSDNRFVRDNFGIAIKKDQILYTKRAMYKPIALCPKDYPEIMARDEEKVFSEKEVLDILAQRKATTVSVLSCLHGMPVSKIYSNKWSNCFNLFVGNTPMDRINHWNSKFFVSNFVALPSCLRIDESFFADHEFLASLGNYLNKNNSVMSNNNSHMVQLIGCSYNKDDLIAKKEVLRKHSYNFFEVNNCFCEWIFPTHKELETGFHFDLSDKNRFSLNENSSKIRAKVPEHFDFLPSKMVDSKNGQWIIELEIERHNDLSKYSNVIDKWVLPKRGWIGKAFTNNPSRVTNSRKLALLPNAKRNSFLRQSSLEDFSYSIHLPSDEVFFGYLILNQSYQDDDIRNKLDKTPYLNLSISDKGQNLRGVISLFESLNDAYKIFSNKFWRIALETFGCNEEKTQKIERMQLFGLLPTDRAFKDKILSELGLPNLGDVNKYLEFCFQDTLEELIKKRVFFQIYCWRCKFCGHQNTKNLDLLKAKNFCSICETTHFVPIDMDWSFRLNSFISKALITHSGLPVLWTLGFLQDRNFSKSFWYLPEVDLFENENETEKKEIDLLCIRNGEFLAVEVKKSAYLFLAMDSEREKFIDKINRILPDTAIVAFEKYCDEPLEIEATKQRLKEFEIEVRGRLKPYIVFKTIVAEDHDEFKEFQTDFGYWRDRTHSFLKKLKNES